jgi:hypothetical protein
MGVAAVKLRRMGADRKRVLKNNMLIFEGF